LKGSPSILAAGLEPVLVEALRRAWPAAKIEGVYSGRETLERVARVPYLALILDHRVADPPAVEVLRRVRSMGLDLPVVYCLAPEELRKRPRKGAQAVLLQPVTAPQVLQALAGMAELAAWVPVVQTLAAAPGSPVADRPAPATREAVPLHVGHSPASTPSPVATVLEAPIPTPLAAAPRAAASRALPTPKTNRAPDTAPNATPDVVPKAAPAAADDTRANVAAEEPGRRPPSHPGHAAEPPNLVAAEHAFAATVAAAEPSPSGRSPAMAAKEEKTRLAVAKLWERFQGTALERVDVLDRAASELQSGALAPVLRLQAEREAHKLAGAVGTFGFIESSQLAREAEQMLKGDGVLGAEQARWLAVLVTHLRQELGQTRHSAPAAVPVPEPSGPLLLFVGEDVGLAERLQTEARVRGWRAARAAHPDAARQWVVARPDAVLLDLDIPGATDGAWRLLRELGAMQPPIPVLVLTARESFTDRVEVVKLGGQGFLSKTLDPGEVFAAVLETWQRQQGAASTVLALDDDPQVLHILEALLKAENIRLTTLQEPRRFWQVLGDTRPDLIMLDVDMPEVGGIELCRVIRQDAQWRDLPVLFLTAHTDAAVVDQLYAAGADDYVSKPIISTELVNRLRNRLERSRLLRSLAETDPLTGLMNRRKAIASVEQFFKLAQRRQQPISMAILDVDHFKRVNDQYGHLAGDQVLTRLSELLLRTFRGEDVVARWGGEEFLVAMYGMMRGDGVQRLAEMLEMLRGESFATPDGAVFGVCFSAGVAQYPEDGLVFPLLYRAADLALQTAKQNGRNRVLGVGTGLQTADHDSSNFDVVLVAGEAQWEDVLMQALNTRGYRVSRFATGLAALEALTGAAPSVRPKVLLLDLDLPAMEGFSLLRRLSQERIVPSLRVIVLTDVEAEIVRARELGAFDHLAKPFSLPALMPRIRRALET